ncbi:hypothetical protein DM860_006299 [Cuscuta australis]|uniref:Uncharacterized protein n=1 Tax=Cuscuta australis TaxID=267555 RepID=A0A328DK69_9ASTE|nr:hypothetical protein DM860_006299 [Cuscuta australis]
MESERHSSFMGNTPQHQLQLAIRQGATDTQSSSLLPFKGIFYRQFVDVPKAEVLFDAPSHAADHSSSTLSSFLDFLVLKSSSS